MSDFFSSLFIRFSQRISTVPKHLFSLKKKTSDRPTNGRRLASLLRAKAREPIVGGQWSQVRYIYNDLNVLLERLHQQNKQQRLPRTLDRKIH